MEGQEQSGDVDCDRLGIAVGPEGELRRSDAFDCAPSFGKLGLDGQVCGSPLLVSPQVQLAAFARNRGVGRRCLGSVPVAGEVFAEGIRKDDRELLQLCVGVGGHGPSSGRGCEPLMGRGRIDLAAHPAEEGRGRAKAGDEGAARASEAAPDRPPGTLAAAIRARDRHSLGITRCVVVLRVLAEQSLETFLADVEVRSCRCPCIGFTKQKQAGLLISRRIKAWFLWKSGERLEVVQPGHGGSIYFTNHGFPVPVEHEELMSDRRLVLADWQREEIAAKLSEAEVWCMSTSQIVTRILEEPARSYGHSQIIEYLDLDVAEVEELLHVGCKRLFAEEASGSRQRTTAELNQLLSHAVPLLPRELAKPMVREQLMHRLRTRRVVALKLLRRMDPYQDDLEPTRRTFEKYGDKETIWNLAKLEHGFSGYNCCEIIAKQVFPYAEDNLYTHALLIERMVRDSDVSLDHLLEAHPIPFLRAIGRIGGTEYNVWLAKIVSIVPSELVSLAISVARRTRAKEALQAIAARCGLEGSEYPIAPRRSSKESSRY